MFNVISAKLRTSVAINCLPTCDDLLFSSLAGVQSATRRRRSANVSSVYTGRNVVAGLRPTTLAINGHIPGLKEVTEKPATTNTLKDTFLPGTLNDNPVGFPDDYYLDQPTRDKMADKGFEMSGSRRQEYDYSEYSNKDISERTSNIDGKNTDNNVDPKDNADTQNRNNNKTTGGVTKSANNNNTNIEFDNSKNRKDNNNKNNQKDTKTNNSDNKPGLTPSDAAGNRPDGKDTPDDYYNYGYNDYTESDATKEGEPNILLYRFLPLIVNIISGAVCFYFARVACKLCMQGFSFAFPLTLATPATAVIFCYLCHVRGWTRVVIPYMDIGYWQCRFVRRIHCFPSLCIPTLCFIFGESKYIKTGEGFAFRKSKTLRIYGRQIWLVFNV